MSLVVGLITTILGAQAPTLSQCCSTPESEQCQTWTIHDELCAYDSGCCLLDSDYCNGLATELTTRCDRIQSWRGSCLEASESPGCVDTGIAGTVCKVMPTCCSDAWSAKCVTATRHLCVADDGEPQQCAPEHCSDGTDNNGNGFADCFDPQCAAAPNCSQHVVEGFAIGIDELLAAGQFLEGDAELLRSESAPANALSSDRSIVGGVHWVGDDVIMRDPIVYLKLGGTDGKFDVPPKNWTMLNGGRSVPKEEQRCDAVSSAMSKRSRS